MRAHAWSATPLGAPISWPEPLKTLVAVMLDARQPMFTAWGPERIMLYNDGYASILGKRHPSALGQTFAEVWFDIMDEVGPILDRAYAGQSTHMDDIAFTLFRNGFAYSRKNVRGVRFGADGKGRLAQMWLTSN